MAPEHINIWKEARDFAILIVLGFAMTYFRITCRECGDTVRQLIIISTYTSFLWIALWKGNEYLSNSVSRKISWIKEPVRRFVVGIATTIAYTFLAMYLITALYEQSFALSIPTGVAASVIITIALSLFMHGRMFLLNWRQAAIKAEKAQQESVTAKYEMLKSQVSPHFLFNSLNALTNLLYEDPDKAVKFIDQLMFMYNYVLQTRDRELVPLQEELSFLDSYLYLQKIRFGEKLKFAVDLENSRTFVAPLALQMLIENAIKHNIVSEDDPLTVSVKCGRKFLSVENNLQKKSSIGDESSGVGLENIRRRYDMLSDQKVIIEEDQKTFRVMLPIIEKPLKS